MNDKLFINYYIIIAFVIIRELTYTWYIVTQQKLIHDQVLLPVKILKSNPHLAEICYEPSHPILQPIRMLIITFYRMKEKEKRPLVHRYLVEKQFLKF